MGESTYGELHVLAVGRAAQPSIVSLELGFRSQEQVQARSDVVGEDGFAVAERIRLRVACSAEPGTGRQNPSLGGYPSRLVHGRVSWKALESEFIMYLSADEGNNWSVTRPSKLFPRSEFDREFQS